MQEAARPQPAEASAPPLPPRAALIDGVDHELDPNPLDIQGMRLQFLSRSQAQARFRLRETELVVPLGLDGAYRIGIDAASGNRVAGRGRWLGPDQLLLEIDTIARISHFTATLNFDDGGLAGHISERAGLISEMALKSRRLR